MLSPASWKKREILHFGDRMAASSRQLVRENWKTADRGFTCYILEFFEVFHARNEGCEIVRKHSDREKSTGGVTHRSELYLNHYLESSRSAGMGLYMYSENNKVSWSLFANGFEWIMSETRFSSLTNTKSSKFGVCPSLLLLGLETIWLRKASQTHSTNMLSLVPDHSSSHLTVGKLMSLTIQSLSKVFACSL